ncbi:MAG: hypothetical protein EOO10_04085 [Chitinophagaceae bacterium]|nr:MAG: hypothetical protein EOO10_04085 [Chitinophagaceae bacterium]
MKKLFIVLIAGVCLSACGDDLSTEHSDVGPGTMPADPTVLRVNQGAIGTDMGGSTKKPDSTRSIKAVPTPPATQDTTRK